MPTQPTIILPDGWQIAQRTPPADNPRAVWWLQKCSIAHTPPVWRDVAGPYTRRSSAIDAWRQHVTAEQLRRQS